MSVKKQLLIDTALTLFYQQGINSVGINEVLKVSGVAKKTLYSHFPTKEDLILATLAARDEKFINWLSGQLSLATNDKQVVTQLFNSLTCWFNNEVPELAPFNGCFFINSAAEYSNNNHPINQYCHQHKLAVRTLIKQHLSTDNEALLTLIFLLKEGAIVSASMNKEYDSAEKCLPLVLGHLNN